MTLCGFMNEKGLPTIGTSLEMVGSPGKASPLQGISREAVQEGTRRDPLRHGFGAITTDSTTGWERATPSTCGRGSLSCRMW